ncbi:MAG TPA: helix-turn-helix domain-containing protein [Planctomycetota bacterium]|nr:helix-turn-helix domain-containing protein [Planctomycetota bacterium]
MGTDVQDLTAYLDSLLEGLPPIITIRQAAERLKVSYGFIWSEVMKGELHAIRLGRCVRIARVDLGLYMLKHSSQPDPAEVAAAQRHVHQAVKELRALQPERVQEMAQRVARGAEGFTTKPRRARRGHEAGTA